MYSRVNTDSKMTRRLLRIILIPIGTQISIGKSNNIIVIIVRKKNGDTESVDYPDRVWWKCFKHNSCASTSPSISRGELLPTGSVSSSPSFNFLTRSLLMLAQYTDCLAVCISKIYIFQSKRQKDFNIFQNNL